MTIVQAFGLLPTDYSGVGTLLYVALAVGTVVTVFVMFLVTKGVKNASLRLFWRLLPIAVVWSFSPLGTRGDWWPAPCGLLFGDGKQKLFALAAMLASTLVLLGLCAVGMLAHRRERA